MVTSCLPERIVTPVGLAQVPLDAKEKKVKAEHCGRPQSSHPQHVFAKLAMAWRDLTQPPSPYPHSI